MECAYCKKLCIKKGFNKNDGQKYFCKHCNKNQLISYVNKACEYSANKMIVTLLCNGCGIRDISRIMTISTTTVIERIKKLANQIILPSLFYIGKKYEVDELKTFVIKKENGYWVCCALEKETGSIVSLSIGKRTKSTLKKVLKPILQSAPTKIHSDRLQIYNTLIHKDIHCVKQYTINKIERKFLNFRTHLKRLCRRSICFSKSVFMLEAILKIYIWRNNLIFQ
jgi:insertion element IS1 protein InsB